MNFNRRGWFSKYIDFRLENPLPKTLPSLGVKIVEDESFHNDLEQAIYYFLQPTGLLYGSLVESPFPEVAMPKSRYFDSLDRVYTVFLESLFACLVADRDFLLDEIVEEGNRLRPVVGVALAYFLRDPRNLFPEFDKASQELSFLRNSHGEVKRFERELGRRITRGARFLYRPELFHNSFLFLDLYSCLLLQRRTLIEPELSGEVMGELDAAQLEWREALIRLLICTGYSDGFIQPPERRIIEHFLKSSGFGRSKLAALRREMRSNLRLEDVELPEMPWLVRRYFLEIVLMTALVDREISEEEHEFVEKLVDKLELWQGEMQQSLAALELFLLQNRGRLHYLKSHSRVAGIRGRIQERATLAVRRNLDGLVNEIKETGELYTLLMKSAREPLTREEKRKVRDQLTDILKTIPALAVFALPGGGIILPVLIRLLPFNVLPSSFED